MIKEGMLENEILYNEVKNGDNGEILKCSSLMLDQEFLIPWDIHNSELFR